MTHCAQPPTDQCPQPGRPCRCGDDVKAQLLEETP